MRTQPRGLGLEIRSDYVPYLIPTSKLSIKCPVSTSSYVFTVEPLCTGKSNITPLVKETSDSNSNFTDEEAEAFSF